MVCCQTAQPMLTETEKYLVRAIQAGDYKAFRMLFDSFYALLCRFAKTYVRSPETAEDIVSEFFVKIWERPEILAPAVSLKSYLCRSIYNSCMNYLTRNRPKYGELDGPAAEKLHELVTGSAGELPSSAIMLAELDEEIYKAVSQLPAECARIFIMSRQEGMSHREIAEKLGIAENTVKVQIFRALSKLRESLKEFF
jgi:RNA polymerase sigma-70 factor (ECF subfamily)